MSQLLEVISLALVQGLTEFLPISSSAHLILVPLLTGWQDPGIAFDVTVHLGTLLAVCAYFRRDILWLAWGWGRSLTGNSSRYYSPLSWYLIAATIPSVIIGWTLHDYVATTLRSPLVIAFATIFFGLLLWASDYFPARTKSLSQMKLKDVMLIGMAQSLALIPGTSRSGITMTASLALGYKRASTAKFSFLLSIPVIVLAGTYEGYKILHAQEPLNLPYLLVGIGIAALSAYFCIHFFIQFIRKMGFFPFVIYRIMLGIFLFYLFW